MINCIFCKHSTILRNEMREIKEKDNATIKLCGTINTECKKSGKSIDFDKNGDLVCSGFERRSEE